MYKDNLLATSRYNRFSEETLHTSLAIEIANIYELSSGKIYALQIYFKFGGYLPFVVVDISS